MTPTDPTRLRQLLDKTALPWREGPDGAVFDADGYRVTLDDVTAGYPVWSSDEERALVIAAVNALPSLLATAEWARKARGVLEEVRRVQHTNDHGVWTECPECGAENEWPCRPGCALASLLAPVLSETEASAPTWTGPYRVSPDSAMTITFEPLPDLHRWKLTSGDTRWRCPKCRGAVVVGEALPIAGCVPTGDAPTEPLRTLTIREEVESGDVSGTPAEPGGAGFMHAVEARAARMRAHPDYDERLGAIRPHYLCVDHAVEVGADTVCPECGGPARRLQASCEPDGRLTETGRRWKAKSAPTGDAGGGDDAG